MFQHVVEAAFRSIHVPPAPCEGGHSRLASRLVAVDRGPRVSGAPLIGFNQQIYGGTEQIL